MGQPHSNDRRSTRTRRTITKAFVEMLGERRYEEIGVSAIAERADLGRSTFYQHFRGKEELLLHSMEPLLEMLATAGEADAGERMRFLVAHFWGSRRLGRTLLAQPVLPAIRRGLAAAIEARLRAAPGGEPDEMLRARAIQVSAAQLALLEAWTKGELTASQEQIGERLAAAARL